MSTNERLRRSFQAASLRERRRSTAHALSACPSPYARHKRRARPPPDVSHRSDSLNFLVADPQLSTARLETAPSPLRASGFQPVLLRRGAVELRPRPPLVEADASRGGGDVRDRLGGDQFDRHPLLLCEANGFGEQLLAGLLGAVHLRHVHAVLSRVEADEPEQAGVLVIRVGVRVGLSLLGLGDPHRPVVDEVPHHVAGGVGDRRHVVRVRLHGVPYSHYIHAIVPHI